MKKPGGKKSAYVRAFSFATVFAMGVGGVTYFLNMSPLPPARGGLKAILISAGVSWIVVFGLVLSTRLMLGCDE